LTRERHYLELAHFFVDQPPGVNLLDLEISPKRELADRWQPDLLGGVVTIEGSGFQEDRSNWERDGLYRPLELQNRNGHAFREVKWTAVPYYSWENRGLKSMRVWVPYARRP
jgi:DUF1680 family protein